MRRGTVGKKSRIPKIRIPKIQRSKMHGKIDNGKIDKMLLLFAVVVLLVIILSGCRYLGGRDDDVNRLAREDFRRGSRGIEMDWVWENLPDVFYDTSAGVDEIQLLVEMRNEGAERAFGYVTLSGFDQNYIGLPYNPLETDIEEWIFDLEGRSIRNANGGFKLIEIPPLNGPPNYGGLLPGEIDLWEGAEEYPVEFKLTACYEYRTVASPIICVDPDPYRITTEKACRPERVENLGSSQGGPVAVTYLDVENIPGDGAGNSGQIIVNMRISNVGSGRVVDINTIDALASGGTYCTEGCIRPIGDTTCPNNLLYRDLNIVDFFIYFQGRLVSSSDCRPEIGYVRLTDGDAEISCEIQVSTPGSTATTAFATPLRIELAYGYEDWIEKRVRIRSLIPER